MAYLSTIIEKIEEFAPLSIQADWDNSGWQVYLGNKDINKVMLALSPSDNVIKQAVESECELILSHHPLFFSKYKNISIDNNSHVIKAIQNNVQIYSAHTNLDSVNGGIADKVAELIGLEDTTVLEKSEGKSGFGRVGKLKEAENIASFVSKLKKIFKTPSVKITGELNKKTIQTVAVLPGSGAGVIPSLKDVDVFITGDIKYHDALEVNNFIAIDAGHFETEIVVLDIFEEILQDFKLDIIKASEVPPWSII